MSCLPLLTLLLVFHRSLSAEVTYKFGEFALFEEGYGTGNNSPRKEVTYETSWILCAGKCIDKGNCYRFAVEEPSSDDYNVSCSLEVNLDFLPNLKWQIYGSGCYAPPPLTPFIRRQDGNVDFARVWNDYKAGFGDTSGEFWLGLDTLHTLTSATDYDLHVIMEDWIGDKKCSMFESFSVGPEADKYRTSLGLLIKPGSDAGNGMAHPTFIERQYNNRQFSTKDQDNDGQTLDCSVDKHGSGGWWFASTTGAAECGSVNPTGLYYYGGIINTNGVNWYLFNKNFLSLKSITLSLMKRYGP